MATVLVGAAVLGTARTQRATRSPLERLVQAAPSTHRTLQPRLSGGIGWAPHSRTEETNEEEIVRFQRVASEVAAGAAADDTPAGRRIQATAALLTGDAETAVTILGELAPAARDVSIWTDLAAAQYAIGVSKDGSPKHLEQALASVDEALRLNAVSAEAIFNRSLALQKLGLCDLARRSWERYLEIDSASGWATEARNALRTLEAPPRFRDLLDRASARPGNGKNELLQQLVASHPQECRAWGEAEILGRWAEAFLAGNAGDAGTHLQIAEQFGSALASRSGERLLADAVAAINAANPGRRRTLAQAHATYRNGRMTYSQEKPAAAERMLRESGKLFASAASPMALVARYYTANSIFDQNRVPEAQDELIRLRNELPSRYRALRAQVDWELGLCHFANARWGAALSSLNESITTFETLGELDNASNVRAIVADAYESLGEAGLARRARAQAMRRLGRATNRSMQVTLAGMSRTAIREQDWPVASTLLAIEIESARNAGNWTLVVDALHRSALVHLRRRNVASARGDLRLATAARAEISDPGLAERLASDHLFIEGVTDAIDSPAGAVTKISSAIAFHERKGQHTFLPQMHVARARAYRSLGDEKAAWRDLESAILELERQRDATPTGDVRAGILATSSDIFEEAIAMKAASGDPAAALHYSERGRARVLVDAAANSPGHVIPSTSAEWAARIPGTHTAISYSPAGDDVYIFTAGATGVLAAKATLSLRELRELAQKFTNAAARDDAATMDRAGASLHAALIAPIQGAIRTADTLVVTGESDLVTIPFSALRDASTNRYLVEDFAIVVSPSITAFLGLARRTDLRRASPDARLLGVGDPRDDLGGSRREVTVVARPYREHTILTGSEATPSAFAAAIEKANVVHFAGHGQRGRLDVEPSLLLAPGTGHSGQLFASEIQRMKMPRLAVAVLAACDTGRGARSDSEGTWSIARSFLIAGAPSVVATLWPIDDAEAPRLFLRLHQQLANGTSPAGAVRRTQLEFLAGKAARPSIWAAIQVIGS